MPTLKQVLLMVLVDALLPYSVISGIWLSNVVIDDCTNFLSWRCPFPFLDLSSLNFMLKCNCHCNSIERWQLSRGDWSPVLCHSEYTNQCCYGTVFIVAEMSLLVKKMADLSPSSLFICVGDHHCAVPRDIPCLSSHRALTMREPVQPPSACDCSGRASLLVNCSLLLGCSQVCGSPSGPLESVKPQGRWGVIVGGVTVPGPHSVHTVLPCCLELFLLL